MSFDCSKKQQLMQNTIQFFQINGLLIMFQFMIEMIDTYVDFCAKLQKKYLFSDSSRQTCSLVWPIAFPTISSGSNIIRAL